MSEVDWHERIAHLAPAGPSPALDRAFFGALAQTATELGPVDTVHFRPTATGWVWESMYDTNGQVVVTREDLTDGGQIEDLAVIEDGLPTAALESLTIETQDGCRELNMVVAGLYASRPAEPERGGPGTSSRPRTSVEGATSTTSLDAGPYL